MHDFLIDRKVIGTPENLLFNGELSWCSGEPKNVLKWRHEIDPLASDCLNVALKLSGKDIQFKFEQKYVDSLCAVIPSFRFNKNIDIPWHYVAPTQFSALAIKKLVNDIKAALATSDISYYTDTYVKQNDLFELMQPAHINKQRLQNLIEESKRGTFLEDFLPAPNGFAQPVVYNRIQTDDSGTKTGRLTVASGPSYMTLNREYRDIISSRWEGGSVWYLDYSSLEPRVFQAHLGRALPENFYNFLASTRLGDSGKTQCAKSMFLKRFYGAGFDVMAADGDTSIEQAKKFAKYIDEDFGVKEMSSKLMAEAIATGKIRNKFGRVLDASKNTKPHVLFNYWTQSSAVETALLGFSRMCRGIKKSKLQIVPICVIHDALIVDVHPDCKKYLQILAKLGSEIPEAGNVEFPMHIERVS